MSLSHVRFVLVEPTHPGNIGAAARAMKAMGLSRLVLVSPRRFPCVEATARASGADDILANAVVVDSLSEALQGCTYALGTSARSRSLAWPTFSAEEAAEQLNDHEELAIVFGTEQSGLTNEQLALCQAQVFIPVNPEFCSLNLSQAVQVLAYEFHKADISQAGKTNKAKRPELATVDELHGLYGHLEQTLTELDFLDRSHPKKLMQRLKHMFHRAELDKQELNIMRGVLSAVNKQTAHLANQEEKV